MIDNNNNNNINRQQNNEGEKAKGGWVLCNSFWALFYGGSFFSIRFCQTHKKIYHKKSSYYLQIKHNRGFLPPFYFILPWSWFS